jgi:hypothetical protein
MKNEFMTLATVADMTPEKRAQFRDPKVREGLKRVLEAAFYEAGDPDGATRAIVRLPSGEMMEGEGAELLFSLRGVLLSILASYEEEDKEKANRVLQ